MGVQPILFGDPESEIRGPVRPTYFEDPDFELGGPENSIWGKLVVICFVSRDFSHGDPQKEDFRLAGMPRLDTTRLRTDGKIQTRHGEPTVSHNMTEPTRQKPADTADTTRLTRV